MAKKASSKPAAMSPKLRKFVESRVQSGRYSSADAVIEAGLRLLQQRERNYAAWKRDGKKKIAAGLADVRQGRVRDIDVVFAEIEEEEAMFERRSKSRKKSA